MQLAAKRLRDAAKRLRDAAKALPSGGIEDVDGRFIAKIDTSESGTRIWIEGPPRDSNQHAAQVEESSTYALGLGHCFYRSIPFKSNHIIF